MASDNKTVAALGRPFTLGMLYDARTDELIPGLTMWDDKTLQDKITESSQHSSAFDIAASDSTESKCTLLDVEASLKVSFLGGLIEVEGSAKYLNDQKKFHNQSRVTLQYKATTNFKQLMIDHLTMEPQQMDVIQKSSATHVVTGILYGTNAFFVFDSEKLEASSVQDIQGSMQAVIKKIPSFDFEGKVKIQLTDEEKALTQKFSCKFYGDFILESNPATFEEAVNTYVQLPKLLGEKEEKAVPVHVWLMPLKNFNPKAAELKKEITDKSVWNAQDNLEDLREIAMRCNDSLEDKVIENFPVIHKPLSTFQKLCGYKWAPLDVMADYLNFPKLGSTNEDPWYYSDEVVTKMREKAKAFHQIANPLKNNSRFRFLIATIANKNYTGATIYHYKNHILVSEDFSKPVLPPVETITDRRDLIWYACDLNLDPNTANYHLTLSERNKKATHGARQSYPDRPERFDKHPQVLCKESLSGQHYWEFEWNDSSEEAIYVAIAYSEIERKSGRPDSLIGRNTISWAFGKTADSGNKKHSLKAFYNNQVLWSSPYPSDDCNRVGVYLDWPAGTLSFYRVSSNTLRHFYTFRTTFTEPVYPGFMVYYEQNYAYLCPLE
ncbi:neoverrucotoxin subunit beta-like [Perca fluviatilis]|uniref:neoverrucotoxin subunit beta-like n=1 Tax=Perca fluviatilis TaxID=8168 RepID=UPI00196622E3|nr:neoverrucotoxin subunit beta-like [Perca fluviatilis]